MYFLYTVQKDTNLRIIWFSGFLDFLALFSRVKHSTSSYVKFWVIKKKYLWKVFEEQQESFYTVVCLKNVMVAH